MSGLISIASNSVGVPTGYGQQAELLARQLLADGHKVASMSNYGLEGIMSEITYPEGVIPHYPRGLTMYSDDVLPLISNQVSYLYLVFGLIQGQT